MPNSNMDSPNSPATPLHMDISGAYDLHLAAICRSNVPSSSLQNASNVKTLYIRLLEMQVERR